MHMRNNKKAIVSEWNECMVWLCAMTSLPERSQRLALHPQILPVLSIVDTVRYVRTPCAANHPTNSSRVCPAIE